MTAEQYKPIYHWFEQPPGRKASGRFPEPVAAAGALCVLSGAAGAC
ncbi:MAG: hypothetical protein ACLVJH_04095 [Faecalibacterium prausnitzii]